jgi:hypothetical protein
MKIISQRLSVRIASVQWIGPSSVLPKGWKVVSESEAIVEESIN